MRLSTIIAAIFLVQSTVCFAAERVVVSAAASLKTAFGALAQTYQHERPGVTVALNFASSAHLASQIEQGAPVDVFASADVFHVQRLGQKEMLAASTTFARNKLVLIVSKKSAAPIGKVADVAHKGVRLITTAKGVPIREYTDRFLENTVKRGTLGPDFARRFRANIVSAELDVRMVAVKVALGEGDAAVVYMTDVTSDIKDKVHTIAIPDDLNVTADYAIGLMASARGHAVAWDFYKYVLSDQGRRQLAKFGFLAPEPGHD